MATVADATAAIVKLTALGRRRKRLVDGLAAVDAEMLQAIRAADAVGVPKLRIAQEAGVARQTVYNVLNRKGTET